MWYLSNMAGRACAGIFGTLAVFPQAQGGHLIPPIAHDVVSVHGENFHRIPRLSTLGDGSELRYDFSRRLKFRASYNKYEYRQSSLHKGVAATFGVGLNTTSLLLDWHPFDGHFRTTIGLSINHHQLSAAAHHNGIFTLEPQTIGAHTIDPRAFGFSTIAPISVEPVSIGRHTITGRNLLQVSARADYRTYAPYVGFGWGNNSERHGRLRYSIDIGAILHGKPQISLNLSGDLPDLARKHFPNELNSLIAREEQEIRDELSKIKFFPVVSTGISYKF